jgi:hypothetical protein
VARLRKTREPSTDRLSASSGTGLPGDNFGSRLAAPKSSPTATDPSPRSHKLVGEVIRLSRRSEERSGNLWPHRLAWLSPGQTLGSLRTPRNAKENLRLAAQLVEPSADALLVYKVYSSTNDPSLGFFPLRRFKRGQRQTSGLPHPTLLRLQVFSTSWRFIPPALFRPCFIPNPSLGLWLSEVSLSQKPPRFSPRSVPRARSRAQTRLGMRDSCTWEIRSRRTSVTR